MLDSLDLDRFAFEPEVRKVLGNCSHMFIRRRLEDPTDGFPRPILLGRRRAWLLRDIFNYAMSGKAAIVVPIGAREE
jgi:hypothetical protein